MPDSQASRFKPTDVARLVHIPVVPKHVVRMRVCALLGALGLGLLAACSTTPGALPQAPTVVAERYVTLAHAAYELDSLATWQAPGGTPWLIASAKSTHQLVVFDADTGKRLRTVGQRGKDDGSFNRPNGLAVVGDLLLVAERDNHRVQVLRLPGFASLGSFGADQLRAPYGLWTNPRRDGSVDVYVTDSFMLGPRFDQVPPLAGLDQRVRRYQLRIDGTGALDVHEGGAFGDTSDDAALRMVESIEGDAARHLMLVADEDPRHLATLREYTLDGRYTGRALPAGTFDGDPEGVALWRCGRHGYWIAADQVGPVTRFHLFDRDSLALRGTFVGHTVAQTDGITLRTTPTPAFPAGAMFAVHADRAVGAFDLRDVAAALKLEADCLP